MTNKEPISLVAAIRAISTPIDGGIRITIDVSEDGISAMPELMRLKLNMQSVVVVFSPVGGPMYKKSRHNKDMGKIDV